jgi:hypothetical protein
MFLHIFWPVTYLPTYLPIMLPRGSPIFLPAPFGNSLCYPGSHTRMPPCLSSSKFQMAIFFVTPRIYIMACDMRIKGCSKIP